MITSNISIWSPKWVMKDECQTVAVNNSDLSTMFLLLNSMIGSGILVQAYVIKEAGLIVIVFEYIVITIMNYTGVESLIRCSESKLIYDYADLAESIYGGYGSITVDASMIIYGYGSLLSYVLIIGSLLVEVSGNRDEWYFSVTFLTIVPITLFTAPLCLLRKFGFLAMDLSIFVIGSIVLLIIIGGPMRHAQVNYDHNYNLGNFNGAFNTIGDIIFALSYITATFHAYQGMKVKSTKRFRRLTLVTTTVGSFMCFITGLAGYLSFGSTTETNILSNFDGAVGSVFKVFLIIHLILFIPGDFVITRAACLRLFKLDVKDLSDITYITFTLFIIYSITIIAIVLQVYASNNNNLGTVVNITGGTSLCMLSFVIPGMLSLKLFPTDAYLYYKNLVLIIFGLIIFLIVIITTARGQ